MRLFANVAALLLLAAGLLVGVTSSSAAPSLQTASAAAPSSGCTVQARSPDLVERCGHCTVIGFASSAARDSLIHQLAKANPPAWFAVGATWIGGDDNLDILGAVGCADRYGGTVERFTN